MCVDLIGNGLANGHFHLTESQLLATDHHPSGLSMLMRMAKSVRIDILFAMFMNYLVAEKEFVSFRYGHSGHLLIAFLCTLF